ncbi:adenine phosphoribosyltransferase [Spiractinospora alimapuensis]|uniref:adenine phosphoribosyltransferase n=1 Tax=Spiractinospora alimapuensis TaxID=2820884 RepID=UPI001EEC62DC|nr:adenine phosphoribosyltransferase [Spiractinospora alimapuensis]QVQ52056.1 adenine phosphoribosyltransferase [Spiractinospora alimapuensis]
MSQDLATLIDKRVRTIPDYPKPGVEFKDITPLLADPAAFRAVVDGVRERYDAESVDAVVGIEARGFILAAPIAYAMGAGFVPIRKSGKLPARTLDATYDLEYGTETMEMHADGVSPGDRVLIVDDVLATGGTAEAAVRLVRAAGGTVVGLSVLMELGFLNGRQRLTDVEPYALTVA